MAATDYAALRQPLHHQQLHYRELYDADYVAANCPPSDYNSDTELDNTVGTWATNYVILGVGLLGCLSMVVRMRFRKTQQQDNSDRSSTAIDPDNNKRKVWIALYFGGTGLAYGLAGFGHQWYDSLAEKPAAWDISTHVVNALALLSLQFYVALPILERTFRVVVTLISGAFLGAALALEQPQIMGLYMLLVLLGMGFYFFSWKQRDWMPSVGCVVYMSGLLVQVILAGRCGDKGYEENCFRDCPLSDPMTFNHNALFHVIVAAALLFQMFGRYTTPIITVDNEEARRSSTRTSGGIPK